MVDQAVATRAAEALKWELWCSESTISTTMVAAETVMRMSSAMMWVAVVTPMTVKARSLTMPSPSL